MVRTWTTVLGLGSVLVTLAGCATGGVEPTTDASAEKTLDATAVAIVPRPASEVTGEATARQRWGELPMRFEENRGQYDERARYVARQRGLTLFATESALMLSLPAPQPSAHDGAEAATGGTHPGGGFDGELARDSDRAEGDASVLSVGLRMWLEGGAEGVRIEPAELL